LFIIKFFAYFNLTNGKFILYFQIADFERLISNFSDQNEQLCQKIEELEENRNNLLEKFTVLQYQNEELKEKLSENEKFMCENEFKKLHDECYDSKRKLADVLTHYEDVEKKLSEKTEAHEKSLLVIKRAVEHIDDLEIHVEQLKSNQPSSLSSTESAKNDEIFTHANSLIMKLREQVEHITNDKDEEIKRLKEELNSKSRFNSILAVSSNATSLNFSNQNIDFPINEKSFNDIIEQNRTATKKIHFLKQRLNSHAQNKIEVEFLTLQLKEAQNDVQETESALRRSATFCGVLLDRLEELTKFLSSLLQKDDVVGKLGIELRKAIARAVDRTLDISRNINHRNSIHNESTISHLSDCSMIDLVDSLASSTIADEQSFIDSLRSDFKPTPTDSLIKSKSNSLTSSRLQRSQKNLKKSSSLFNAHSEDEEWSEPDRDISAQRIGIKTDDPVIVKRSTTTSDEDDDENDFGADHKLIKKSEWKLIQGKIKSLEMLLSEKNDKILEVSGMLLDSENDAKEKLMKLREKLDETERDLKKYRDLYQQTSIEVCELRETLQQTKGQKDQLNVEIRVMNSKFENQMDENRKQRERLQTIEEQLHKVSIEYEAKCNLYEKLVMASEKREEEFRDELQVNWIRKTVYNQLLHELDKKKDKLKEYQHKFSMMEDEMKIMQSHVLENEEKFEKISKNLDTATLQLSTASIERSRALNEKRTLDTKLKKITEEFSKLNIEKQELNLKIADLEVFNAKLQNKLLTGEKLNAQKNISSEYGSGYASEEANAANRSPSISSNDEKDINVNCSSCQRLRNEVGEIKKSMQHSKRSLELAYAKLRNQNLKKAQTEMDIKQQIMKTQNVLQNVRTNMENEMSRSALRTDEK
jgi:centrosomin